MHKATIFILVLLITYVAIFIAQLWFEIFSATIFFKLTVTFAVVFFTTLIVLFICRYLNEEARQKRDKFIS